MTTFINNSLFLCTMKPKTLTSIALLSLLAFNANAQTKHNKNYYVEHAAISCPKPKHNIDLSGVGIGAIAEDNAYGAELNIFYATPNLQDVVQDSINFRHHVFINFFLKCLLHFVS